MLIRNVEEFRKAVRIGPYVWPGGYAAEFITNDGACICHKCANKERRNIVDSISTKTDDGWFVVGWDCAANHDETNTCDHCGKDIE